MESTKMNLHYSAFQLILNGTCRSAFNSILSHDRKPENVFFFFLMTKFKFTVLKWYHIFLHLFLLICNNPLCQWTHCKIIKLKERLNRKILKASFCLHILSVATISKTDQSTEQNVINLWKNLLLTSHWEI